MTGAERFADSRTQLARFRESVVPAPEPRNDGHLHLAPIMGAIETAALKRLL
jgi:hypothetical protein